MKEKEINMASRQDPKITKYSKASIPKKELNLRFMYSNFLIMQRKSNHKFLFKLVKIKIIEK